MRQRRLFFDSEGPPTKKPTIQDSEGFPMVIGRRQLEDHRTLSYYNIMCGGNLFMELEKIPKLKDKDGTYGSDLLVADLKETIGNIKKAMVQIDELSATMNAQDPKEWPAIKKLFRFGHTKVDHVGQIVEMMSESAASSSKRSEVARTCRVFMLALPYAARGEDDGPMEAMRAGSLGAGDGPMRSHASRLHLGPVTGR